MFVIKYRKIFFAFSVVLIAAAIFGIFKYGFNMGIDFTGGSMIQASYSGILPDKSIVEAKIDNLKLGGFLVRTSSVNSYIITTRELTDAERNALVSALNIDGLQPVIERENTVGPVAGAELKSKAIKAVAAVIVMILLFVTFAFRKVSKPVSSWKYGVATILALIHDVIVPAGVFVFLGHLLGYEIDLLFVSGLLAILGYSVHDTIVVFDRVRENLNRNNENRKTEEFEVTVGNSVTQTMGRSINTSLTIFIVLLALYFIGSSATKDFALLLIVGIVAGTYSSIFVASPLLVTFYKLQRK